MHVRMQGKVLSPGMQHGDHTCFCMEIGPRELFNRLPDGAKQKVIHPRGIMHEQAVEFIGNRKHNMKIGNREQVPLAVFDPGFALVAEPVDCLRQFKCRSQSFLYRRSNGLNRLVRRGLAT